MHLLRLIFSFYITCLSFLIFVKYGRSDSVFNYEISDRVVDFLKSFTDKISRAFDVPYRVIQARNDPVNLTAPVLASKKLLFPILLEYSDLVSDVLLCLENGMFYAYSGLLFFNVLYKDHVNSFYLVNSDGTPSIYLGNITFYPELRPWYVETKATLTSRWVGPFIANAQGANPAVTLTRPIFYNDTVPNSKNNHLIGILAANIYLTSISTFLKNAYQNTDRSVFVVDKETGYLIASTMDDALSTTDDNGTVSFYASIIYIFKLFLSKSVLIYILTVVSDSCCYLL